MLAYVARRLFQGALAVLGVSLIVFVGARLSGDVTFLLAPADASAAEIAALRADLGLDQPLPLQYLRFLGDALQGDLGRSLQFKTPVLDLVWSRMGATLALAGAAFAFAVGLGIPLGVLAAVRPGSVLDKAVSAIALLGQAVPNFWFAMLLILVFSVGLGWFPAAGRGGIEHLILPAVALGWFSLATIMRVTRSSMLEVTGSEYVKLARLKGAGPLRVYGKHALRNALLPVLTLAGINLAHLIGGTVIVEQVFAWPGLGTLIVGAVQSRDYPLVQAGVLVTSVVFVGVSLAVDLLYGLVDPRIRQG